MKHSYIIQAFCGDVLIMSNIHSYELIFNSYFFLNKMTKNNINVTLNHICFIIQVDNSKSVKGTKMQHKKSESKCTAETYMKFISILFTFIFVCNTYKK